MVEGSEVKAKEPQDDNWVERIVDDMTLLDDELMSKVFDDNIPAAELLLRNVLVDDELEVVSVTGQKEFKNPLVGGRDIRLDILIPIGWLMKDFACREAKDMHYTELAKGVRHYKEEGGRKVMSEAVERYAEARAKKAVEAAVVKSTIEDAVSYGMSKEQIVAKVCDKYKVSEAEAVKLYGRYAG